MSELAISSTGWLAISLRNGAAIVFNLNDTQQCQSIQSNEPSKAEVQDDDENTNDLNRNLIKFSPDGRKLAINGQNKQIYIYIPSNDQLTKIYWQLHRTITVNKRASAFDLTNEFLLIADKSGDVYQTNLSTESNLILTPDDCIMGHLSMLLDIAFIRTKENDEFLLTADRDEKIRLSHYPNAYNIQGYCLGHTEFVSHVKLIDSNQIISASGDGTLRLWHLPDCVELNAFQTKTLISSAKEIFYGSVSNSKENESSSVDYSIWKMAVTTSPSISIALSIYAHRHHSIYVFKLENSLLEPRKLTFDTTYGAIIDYYFSANELYILFDTNRIIHVNIQSCDSTIAEISLDQEFQVTNNNHSNEIIFKQLFKTRGTPGDSSYHKRKNQRIEQQEEKRRQKKQ